MTDSYSIGSKNKVRQLREKARYDKELVHAVLDAGLVAAVGFVQDGAPVVVPMIYGREGDTIYLHGARKARVVRLLEQTDQVCVNVTLLDGLVFARSAFNSSMNYRSATVFGTPSLVETTAGKLHAMRVISDHTMPGRWAELRDPLPKEVKMTGVIAITIASASAKIAQGMPADEEEDYAIPVWAGVLPVESRRTTLQSDQRLLGGVEPSAAVRALQDKLL
ncbi:MAG: pyridoxamine 5'-phosphate oxidase family protein [Gammaproteobacteria bacterium]|nr:pyridoxamine 5'-phosphate oxidase family protein [Gammaproteobacteria bacterium]MDH5303408.1 pyridoxamine 5'-phosphate oxidase family protein [Gammaproteobacteria bacterium]MDH5322487.1 pyridoxamine 5'-phosphate oxidase family protein [Gammaproteobacteria bacterium]